MEERERAVTEHQAEAAALKAELQRLADTMRTQAEKQVKDSAEDKLATSRHQARLDTLQVRHGQLFKPAQMCTLMSQHKHNKFGPVALVSDIRQTLVLLLAALFPADMFKLQMLFRFQMQMLKKRCVECAGGDGR